MKWMQTILCVILFAAAVTPAPVPATDGSAEVFAKLKSLAGHWEEQQATDAKAKMDIHVTSAGSAVIEQFTMIQDGKPVEMITMYYLDGDQLKMTHYCETGNQPTMHGTYSPDTRTLTFDFAGATGMNSLDDGHMHHAVYTFVDNDHLRTVWTFQKNQKDVMTEDTNYVRIKR